MTLTVWSYVLVCGVNPACSGPIYTNDGATSVIIYLIALSIAFHIVGRIPMGLISDTYLTTVELVLLRAASLHWNK